MNAIGMIGNCMRFQDQQAIIVNWKEGVLHIPYDDIDPIWSVQHFDEKGRIVSRIIHLIGLKHD